MSKQGSDAGVTAPIIRQSYSLDLLRGMAKVSNRKVEERYHKKFDGLDSSLALAAMSFVSDLPELSPSYLTGFSQPIVR